MTASNWIVLAIWGFAQLTALVAIYVNIRLKIKELEMKIESIQQKQKDNQTSFHIHEQQNEKMFDKFEKKMDQVYDSVNELKDFLMKQ